MGKHHFLPLYKICRNFEIEIEFEQEKWHLQKKQQRLRKTGAESSVFNLRKEFNDVIFQYKQHQTNQSAEIGLNITLAPRK